MYPKLAAFNECTGCLVCIDSCSHQAITASCHSDGFFYPRIDTAKCTGCGLCGKKCPIVNGYSYERSNGDMPVPYAAWSTRDDFRMKSSSGGAFPELAKVVLNKGGVVAGAVIDGLHVKHVFIDKTDDLPLLQGSKYLQSDTRNIFRETLAFLKKGKDVLFSGTPCHIGGLDSFLENRKYSGILYSVDLICHGVPSRLPLDLSNKKSGYTLKEIKRFRNKDESWSKTEFFCDISKSDGSVDDGLKWAGRFISECFLHDLTLRPSCYDCQFAFFERKSDITLADFWLIKKYKEEQKKGISLLITNTQKGADLLKESELAFNQTTWGNTSLWYNSRFFSGKNHVGEHPARQLMPLLMNSMPIEDLNRMYGLQDCEDSQDWTDYKKHHNACVNNNYRLNKHRYFNLMLNKVPFVNIVSFQMAYNYGSVLQSYALKQAIERLGYDVRHINLKPDCFETIAFNWKYDGAENARNAFDNFRKRNFPHSLNLYDDKGKMIEFNDSDIFVVGSDQVWNLKYSDEYWREFFLAFVSEKNKKIAYATSFGGSKLKTNIDTSIEIDRFLHRFNVISCREHDGIICLKNEFGINAFKVLDPTLLNIDYSSLFSADKYLVEEKELIFFGFGIDRLVQYEWIKYIGQNLRLNARIINGNPTEESFLYSHYVAPDEWLSCFCNSSMVITNSFHAMLFAIIFKKPFIIIPRSIQATADENEMSRFISLLSDLGLETRYFSSFEEIQSDHRWKQPIDYVKVYEKLEPLRESSLNFLKTALER